MEEISTSNSLETIHFPRQIKLIKKLRHASFIINDTVLLISFATFLVWITNAPVISVFLFQELSIFPFVSVLFILSGLTLIFGAKRHLLESHHDSEKDVQPWWTTAIPILLASATAILGFINFTGLTDTGLLTLFHTSRLAGLCFFLIGLALIPPFTRIPHRFHITQFLISTVFALNVFISLENIYHLFSPLPAQHLFFEPIATNFVYIIFSLGIFVRWSNRGFLGNFTLDSTVSTFAFRLFLINLLLTPLIALALLALLQWTPYNMYQILTLAVVCIASASSLILWINVKLLYGFELEHLLMKESLHSHNINLATEKETLQKRMVQLEQEKQQYLDKIKSRDSWRDATESQG